MSCDKIYNNLQRSTYKTPKVDVENSDAISSD